MTSKKSSAFSPNGKTAKLKTESNSANPDDSCRLTLVAPSQPSMSLLNGVVKTHVNVGADSDGSTTSSKNRLNAVQAPKAQEPEKPAGQGRPEEAVGNPGPASHDYGQASALSARVEEAKGGDSSRGEEKSVLPKDWVMFLGTLTSLLLIVE